MSSLNRSDYSNGDNGLSSNVLAPRYRRTEDSGVQAPTKAAPDCIAVVEDDDRVREALAFQLGTAGYGTVGFTSAEDLMAEDIARFECVIADIFLPRIDGLRLQAHLNELSNFVSVVFITGRGDLALGVEAMKRGAVDVLEKPVASERLLNAIERGVGLSRGARTQRIWRADLEIRFQSLPPRQREVFTLITAGLLNKQVAAEMRITERTVKVHRERLRRKMGADSLAELSRMAEILQIHSAPRHTASKQVVAPEYVAGKEAWLTAAQTWNPVRAPSKREAVADSFRFVRVAPRL
ncbi:MAG TPA: response regulator [Candidatus Binataceae bacterium]|nr:response regulator [Candidatus Binataceae bacterium]